MNRFLKLSLLGALALASQASAGFVDLTENYNVLTFGSINSMWDQSEGKVAAGGNVTLTGYGIGRNTENTLYSLISGGNVIMTDGSVKKGGIFAAGDVSLTRVNVEGAITENGDLSTIPFSFSEKYTDAKTLSNFYASEQSDNWQSLYSTLYLNGTEEVNYYTISANDLSGVSSLKIADQNNYSIVNVTGSNVNLSYIDMMNYQTGTKLNTSHILFNFIDATSISLGSFYGNILAADANVTAKGGQMYGSMIANSISGQYEFHLGGDFNPPEEPPHEVPEGSPVIMIITGSALLLCSASRKSIFAKR